MLRENQRNSLDFKKFETGVYIKPALKAFVFFFFKFLIATSAVSVFVNASDWVTPTFFIENYCCGGQLFNLGFHFWGCFFSTFKNTSMKILIRFFWFLVSFRSSVSMCFLQKINDLRTSVSPKSTKTKLQDVCCQKYILTQYRSP